MNFDAPISKSQFIKGLSCLKKVWLYRYKRDLASPISDVQEGIFTQGHEVGKLAHTLFPGGHLIDDASSESAVKVTKNLIENGSKVIFESAFRFDDLFVRPDIIFKNEDGSWDIFEVKSSTKEKKEHLPDIAIQSYVLGLVGIKLNRVHLIHLNSNYCRGRGEVDAKQIFTIIDLTEKIRNKIDEINKALFNIREVIRVDVKPEVFVGSFCKNPHICEFKDHCWSDVSLASTQYLGRMTDKSRGDLRRLGVEMIVDIPESFPLSPLQKIEVYCHKVKLPYIERDLIKEHLRKLEYPLYFLDFESIGYAVPPYFGIRPYEHLPFQYSIHIQRYVGAKLEHFSFLHEEESDPNLACAEALLDVIDDIGSVVAYHSSFENSIIEKLAKAFPDRSTELHAIRQRLWDLEIPFSKHWYWDYRFYGRSSIKSVLPILDPGMSYENLNIQKGDEAKIRYQQFLNSGLDDPIREHIKNNLLKYCAQDTLSMVTILDHLNNCILN